MPKYWGKQIFTHGRFLEVGQKQKTEKKKERRAKVGDNNGQATHGALKPPRPIIELNHFLCKWCYVIKIHCLVNHGKSK